MFTFAGANLDSDIAPASHLQTLLPYTPGTPHRVSRGSLNFIVSLLVVPRSYPLLSGNAKLRRAREEHPSRNTFRNCPGAYGTPKRRGRVDLPAADSSGL